MEKPFLKIEQKEKGSDVNVLVLFTRHAEKDSHGGDITKKGQIDSQEKGRAFGRLESIKKYQTEGLTHSGHKRTAGTAFLIKNPEYDLNNFESLSLDEKMKAGEILDSSIDRYSDEADKKYAELANGNYSTETEAVEYFINLKDKRYDEETLSSIEMSSLVTKDLLNIIEKTKTMPSHSKKIITNVVHSGIFEHFLIDLLKKRNEEKPLESIGGPLNFLGKDDFRIYIERKDLENVTIKFRFRDKKYYSISEHELREML